MWWLYAGFAEEGRHIDRDAIQQRRGRRLAAAEHAVLEIAGSGELEDGDRFDALVDDPVLEDGRLGIVGALDNKIALRIVGAGDFGHQIGAEPETVLATRIGVIASNRRTGSQNLPARTRIRNSDVTTTPRRVVS